MGLIVVDGHTTGDLLAWTKVARQDAAWSLLPRLERLERRAMHDMEAFCKQGPCYVGVSWGKDSVVVAHLAWRIHEKFNLPIYCIRGRPIDNPHIDLVRQEFLRMCPVDYHEIDAWCIPDANGEWHATGTFERGFNEISLRRYISGVRAQESSKRKRRLEVFGVSSKNTCAPLIRWTDDDVFAYLRKHELPVHPAYAMSFGGRLPRGRLRVAWLTLRHGDGRGRAEWEKHYYGWRLIQIRAAAKRAAKEDGA